MRFFSFRTCNTIVLTTSTLRLVMPFSRGLWQGRIDSSHSGSTKSFRRKAGLSPMSKAHLICNIRNAVKPKLMAILSFFSEKKRKPSPSLNMRTSA